MAVSVVRMCPGRGSEITLAGGWRVENTYKVIGVNNELAVHNAVDATSGLAVPQKGQPHPENLTLICDSVRTDWEDQGVDGDVWVVTVTYISPDFDPGGLAPTEYLWSEILRNEDAHCDKDGKPFLNAVGDPLMLSFPDEKNGLRLEVWQTLPIYDPSTAAAIRGRVNLSALTIFSTWSVAAQQMILRSYRPENRKKLGDSGNERVYFCFEFSPGTKPFQPRAVNRGFNAWYSSSSKKGPIYPLNNNSSISDPVLLDLTGIPLNSSYYRVRANPLGDEQTITTSPVVPANVTDTLGDVSSGFVYLWALKDTYEFTGFIPGIM